MRTETQEFKDWFKKSKVVDLNKKPLPVYHGTTENFTEFHTSPLQKKSINGVGQNAVGSCFSESKEVASYYPFSVREGVKRKVLEVYLSIQKPKKYRTLRSLTKEIMAFYERNELPLAIFDVHTRLEIIFAFRKELIEQGYDGITYLEGPPYKNTTNKARVWVAFQPEQIRIINEQNE